ncbi:MAG: hypothetical protein JWQ03_2765, partial [Variovorax sp.]|nr:hypothetical protein [Variovorax sp.]
AGQAATILSAAQNFDSTTFAVGSDLDKVLDATAAVLQDSNGAVKAAVKAVVKALGTALPTPASGATGASGK